MESPPLPGDKGDATRVESTSLHSGTSGHRPTEINALLGRGTHFEGKLYFDGRVRVDGSFRGEIRGEDVLVIGEGALVVGQIHVATCIVTGGEVEADIRARDAIELYAPSKVAGSLHAPAIFIDRGVQFDGTCKMAPLDEQAGERERERGSGSFGPGPEAGAGAGERHLGADREAPRELSAPGASTAARLPEQASVDQGGIPTPSDDENDDYA